MNGTPEALLGSGEPITLVNVQRGKYFRIVPGLGLEKSIWLQLYWFKTLGEHIKEGKGRDGVSGEFHHGIGDKKLVESSLLGTSK